MTFYNYDKCCPKCKAVSGDAWWQCGDACPVTGSPHFSEYERAKYASSDPKKFDDIFLHAKIHIKGTRRGIDFLELSNKLCRSMGITTKESDWSLRLLIDCGKLSHDDKYDIIIKEEKK